jgi:hypothetical protein
MRYFHGTNEPWTDEMHEGTCLTPELVIAVDYIDSYDSVLGEYVTGYVYVVEVSDDALTAGAADLQQAYREYRKYQGPNRFGCSELYSMADYSWVRDNLALQGYQAVAFEDYSLTGLEHDTLRVLDTDIVESIVLMTREEAVARYGRGA